MPVAEGVFPIPIAATRLKGKCDARNTMFLQRAHHPDLNKTTMQGCDRNSRVSDHDEAIFDGQNALYRANLQVNVVWGHT